MQIISTIPCRVYLLRHQRVLLDEDVAQLCGVATGLLHLTVRRYRHQFPGTAMFQLTATEHALLCQQKGRMEVGTASPCFTRLVVPQPGQTAPYVFTAQGVKVLIDVLKTSSTGAHPLTEAFKHLQDETVWQREWEGRERIGF